MTAVCLHVGAMKSGTSYLQHVLSSNREALLAAGVLFPGRRWRDQVLAAEDAVGILPKGKQATPGAWRALAEEVMAFEGPTSVISMESLSAGDRAAAERVVESFPGRRVKVILTARDLARVVPAQWQESIKNGAPLAYDKFLALISTKGAKRLPGARAFWGPQDLGRILRTWQPFVEPADLVVVTVPGAGAPRDVLWQRFSEAAELPRLDVDLTVAANESLGATSAELMRQLNRLAQKRDLPRQTQAVLKQTLAKQILSQRAESEPILELPDAYRAWAARASDQIIDDITTVSPTVIGDIDDLRVHKSSQSSAQSAVASRLHALLGRTPVGTQPEASSDELLEAALDAIMGLSDRLSQTRKRQRN